MRRAAVLPAILASWFWWGGCSQAPDTAGPRQTVDRYFAAARTDDWEAFYQTVSSDYRAGRSPEEFSAWARSATPDFVHALTARTTHEVVSVDVEGDRASVKLRLQVPDLQAIPGLKDRLPSGAEVLAAPLTPVDQTFSLLREEGEWRIILAPPPQPDPKLLERVESATEVSLPPEDPSAVQDAGR